MDELPDHQIVIALSVLAVRYTDQVELLTGLDLCEAIAWQVGHTESEASAAARARFISAGKSYRLGTLLRLTLHTSTPSAYLARRIVIFACPVPQPTATRSEATITRVA
jgi:hypothetical protein